MFLYPCTCMYVCSLEPTCKCSRVHVLIKMFLVCMHCPCFWLFLAILKAILEIKFFHQNIVFFLLEEMKTNAVKLHILIIILRNMVFTVHILYRNEFMAGSVKSLFYTFSEGVNQASDKHVVKYIIIKVSVFIPIINVPVKIKTFRNYQ